MKRFLDEQTHIKTTKRVRLIKGSHIIVPRLHEGDHAFILQNSDNRIVFIIPYERDFSVHRHHRHPGRGGREAGLHAGGDRLSLRDRQPLHGEAGDAGRRRVDLFRRAPAVRRRRRQSLGGDARLSSRGRRHAGIGATCAAALGVRRQDHDLPAAGRARAEAISRRYYPHMGAAWTADAGGGRRRAGRRADLRGGVRPLRRRRRLGEARPAQGTRARALAAATARAWTTCWRASRRWPISAAISAAISTRPRCAT